MTYSEILQAHNDGKIFAGCMREDASDFSVLAFDTAAEAEKYCHEHWLNADGENGNRVVGIESADMEVTDAAGYYSGSGRRYSLIPMIYPVMEG